MNIKTDPSAALWLIESLERSEAQIDAGQTVPLDAVLQRARTTLADMKRRQIVTTPKSTLKM